MVGEMRLAIPAAIDTRRAEVDVVFQPHDGRRLTDLTAFAERLPTTIRYVDVPTGRYDRKLSRSRQAGGSGGGLRRTAVFSRVGDFAESAGMNGYCCWLEKKRRSESDTGCGE